VRRAYTGEFSELPMISKGDFAIISEEVDGALLARE
jgi:hypothetical protein